MAASSETRTIGVVIERREIASQWQDHAWSSITVLPSVPDLAVGQVVGEGGGRVRYYAGSVDLELHRTATSSYLDNLQGEMPQIYVVLRRAETGALPYRAYLATVAPDEAQTHVVHGDDLVDALPMPDVLRGWIETFVAHHHVEVPEYKRERKPHDPRKGPPPPRRPGGNADGQ